jgi:hypothetical protein
MIKKCKALHCRFLIYFANFCEINKNKKHTKMYENLPANTHCIILFISYGQLPAIGEIQLGFVFYLFLL